MQAENGFEAQARKQRVMQAVSAGLTSAEICLRLQERSWIL